ncbi:7187_t:CDS:2 [Ambispora leptoticha]|uniref:7187_t:CDS:1 n=1 Tax=Ambispora leptoticha TaxID=144679 RepID=A0A9N9B1E7_9GLOM|nr:7187_t:CDS:2 [Ambispora leptoticha]
MPNYLRQNTVQISVSAARTFVILTNTLTLLVGLILGSIGIYGLYSPDVRLYSSAIPLATIIIGLLVFIISIIGCCGAVWENRPVLTSYFVILLVLVILQVIAAVLALSDSHNVESVLDKAWQAAYDSHPKLIRDIEDEYSCCGFKDVLDRAVPKRTPSACVDSSWFGYDIPCYDSLYRSYKHHQTTLGVWGIILAIVQFLALGFAYILITCLPKDSELEREYRSEHDRLVQEGRGRREQQHNPQYYQRQHGQPQPAPYSVGSSGRPLNTSYGSTTTSS